MSIILKAKIIVFFKKNIRIIVAVQCEKNIASTGILDVIICKFCNQQKFGLIIPLIIKKNLKLDLYNVIFPLYLAVNLKIKSNRRLLFNAK